MAATRLALSMDESVVERARRLAERRNTSISKLFVLMEQQRDVDSSELPPLTKLAEFASSLVRPWLIPSLPAAPPNYNSTIFRH